MAQTATINAKSRTATGKGAARTLRREGQVPAVVYGRGRDPEALILDGTALERTLTKIRAATTIIDVTVDARQPFKALIREIQRDPVRPSTLLHVDLYEVHANEEISVEVPIKFIGTADGVRNSGGVFEVLLHDLQIRVLPADIPDSIEVDVNPLIVGQSIHVSDLRLAKGTVLNDPTVTICTVVAAKVEEAAPAGAEPGVTSSEPELIRKPKPTDDDAAPAKG